MEQRQIWPIRRAVFWRHIGVEQLNAHGIGRVRVQASNEAPQICCDAFVGIEAEHPIMRQLSPRHVEQKSAMPPLRALARLDVLFPGLIGNDQRDLRMTA